jgi:thioesterase domain-containing protein
VEALFGWRVPIAALLQHPTIEGLATAYWRLTRAADTPLMALREAGARPPLFFIHADLNGGGLYCGRLARALDPDQPFYALAPLRGRGERPPTSIEEMATRYLEIIRRTRPSGPVALGGYCHGALVAYEIARRVAGTRPVTTVVMIHPSPVEPRLAPVDGVVRLWCRLRRRDEAARVAATVRVVQGLKFVRESTAADLVAWLGRKASARWRVEPAAHDTDAVARDVSGRDERHDADAWERNIRAVFAFVPRRYQGRVMVFAADGSGSALTRSWGRASPRTSFVAVPGNHRTCVTTHIQTLGASLESELRLASGDSGFGTRDSGT